VLTDFVMSRAKRGEQALLVHVSHGLDDDLGSFEEFEGLAIAAGAEVVLNLEVKREKPDPKFYIGKGKVAEIKGQVNAREIDLVMVNRSLSPAQERNLEKEWCVPVIDRSGLILNIFAQRARSFEGKLQVELAQLEHIRTRLVRGWTHLERQKGGIGLRGPGETQLETDKRLLVMRIKTIHKRLKKVESQREQSRRARTRRSIPTISLVGYTNAGKSTLFNKLTDSNVFVADQLFATLDPTIRQLNLPNIGHALLADTVGFLANLPHELVAAFKSTLEETCLADLLLHVVDISDPLWRQRMEDVRLVLEEIGAKETPELIIFNKVDKLKVESLEKGDQQDCEGFSGVYVSAVTGQGIDELKERVSAFIGNTWINTTVTLHPNQGALRSKLYQLNAVKEEVTTDVGDIVLTVRLQREDYLRLFPEEQVQ
jgi:GTP-binding protein HflX